MCEARIVDDAGREVAARHRRRGRWCAGRTCSSNIGATRRPPREALRDGWYHTGDIGTRDADGYFFIHDRKKNMIISGGENIYPAEVERVLHAHPAVAEGAVIGRPDPKWQEVPVAYVVRRAGSTIDARALEAHLLSELARFKVPREYRVRRRAAAQRAGQGAALSPARDELDG